MEFYNLKVKKVQPETEKAVTVKFALTDEQKQVFQFEPGQHLKLKADINGEAVERFYSICAGGEDFIQVGIKRVNGGAFSNFVCDRLKDGDTISVQAPQGDFCLPTVSAGENNFLFVAAGSGITPILAMINSLLTEHEHAQVTLIYINSRRQETMFFRDLENLKNTYMTQLSIVHVLTREPRDLAMLSVRPNEQTVVQILDHFVAGNPDHTYLCGPLSMIELFRETLISRGVDKKNIHMELFGTPDSEQPTVKIDIADDVQQEVTIMSGGRSQIVALGNGEKVLDAALEAGADVPFACKGGVCATCKAKLIEGEADMLINYGLEDDEVEKGYVLTCQAVVKSEKATFDFDV